MTVGKIMYDVIHNKEKHQYEVMLRAGFVSIPKGIFDTREKAEDYIKLLCRVDKIRLEIKDSLIILRDDHNMGTDTFKKLVREILEEM